MPNGSSGTAKALFGAVNKERESTHPGAAISSFHRWKSASSQSCGQIQTSASLWYDRRIFRATCVIILRKGGLIEEQKSVFASWTGTRAFRGRLTRGRPGSDLPGPRR